MNFNLTISSYNPRTDALIIAELINNHCKHVINVVWSNDSKNNKNALLRDSTSSLLSEKDLNVGRYFARTLDPNLYGSCKPSDKTEIDHWLSFAIGPLESSILKHKALSYLDHALASKTWLTAKKLTIADIYVFSTLFENQLLTGHEKEYPNIARWYQQMLSLPDIITVLSAIEQQKILSKTANTKKDTPEKSEKSVEMKVQQNDNKQEGKFIDLPGAEMGKIVVRFPPEPSGYLHIGHAKAVLLNQYYADTFQGKLIVRFDDTNPAKENEQFTNAILEDLELLQIKPYKITRTSDYFDVILEYCTKLIKDGKAYVDDTPNETMKEQRERKEPSVNRENSVEKNLMLWKEMQQGTTKGQECCVRAKIDYKSMNGCLRDPTIYRCKLETHPQTGKKYFVYPTYDFACPIVDSIEDITHTLRTTEYHDRDDQFYWIIDALGIRRPYIWEYSRLNMTNTVLSKRRLTWFVSEGLVDGWDDPRLPTVRGILRRGMTVDALKQFIIAQGSSRSVVFMEWDKIWAFNKKIIDPIAHRYTALTCAGMVPVHVVDATNGSLTVQNHPKDASKGTKTVHISPNIFIEQNDADMLVEGQNATFINWGNLLIQKIDRTNGVVRKIQARLNLEDKNYKNTLKITWLSAPCENNNLVRCYAVYFDHIIKQPVLGKEDDFKDFVATNTRTEVEMLGETELKRVKKGEIIELQRKGFFRCDVQYDFSSFSSREQPIILFHIPDGRASSSGVNHSNNAVGNKTKMNTQKCDKNDKVKKTQKQASISTELQSSSKLKSTSDNTLTDNNTVKLANQLVEGSEKVKQLRDLLKQEETKLQNLRTEYMNKTGVEWDIKKPHVSVTSSCSNDEGNADMNLVDINKVSSDIEKQGNKIRQLKSSKAGKDIIDKEVALLLTLKSNYKKISGGQEWKPPKLKESCPTDKIPVAPKKPHVSVTSSSSNDEGNADMNLVDIDKVSSEIEKQGNKIRQLKSSKAGKDIIDKEVALLLTLKSNYKKISGGQEWKPPKLKESCPTDKIPVAPKKPHVSVTSSSSNDEGNADMNLVDINKVLSEIEKQGNKIRQLKSSKAGKDIIDKEVALLLTLKSNYKKISGGQEWKPPKLKESCPTDKVPVAPKKMSESEISKEIQKQGDKVRQLKSTKADKSTVEAEVKVLLHLKDEYALITGKAWQQTKTIQQKSSGNGKSSAAKGTHSKHDADTKTLDVTKTGTRLGLEAKKKENFFEWYSQVITKSGMIEYYDVSGCYVLRPWSYGIWKIIKEYIDTEITNLGVQECYFPIFVTRAVLEKEKAHIADFAPEVAWVTKCGSSDLIEPIAIRPTSETVMYPAYAKWLRSDTELPLKLNQWNNVVRWEFKDPKPFLRTREFLWQEGHTAFATKAEADEEVLTILDMYSRVYEELLAVPVVKGRKTEKEKFAGGEYTTTVEAFISTSGRAIQGATSHHLGQNFSKMFNIQVEGTTADGVPAEGDGKTFVYQNSWGLTTRTIGVMIMVHGDDKGLVLPPNVSSIQAVLVPCGITATTTVEERDLLQVECDKLVKELSKDKTLRLKADYRNNRTPGWKFNHWELKGVPVRIELGPKDLKNNQVTLVRRDTFERVVVKRGAVLEGLQKLLSEIQKSMFIRAKKDLDEHIVKTEAWNEFGIGLDNKKILLSPFCGNPSCEEKIKMDSARQDAGEELGALSMGAKSLCIPFEQPQLNIPVQDLHCIHPDCSNQPKFYTLFGRSY